MNQKTKNLIKKLELELLKPEVRKSEEKLNKLLADDFFEIAKDGKRYSKKDIIKILPQRPEEIFIVKDFEIKKIASNTILATYIADREIVETNQKSRTLCSSLWQKKNGKWQMIFFQGTPTGL